MRQNAGDGHAIGRPPRSDCGPTPIRLRVREGAKKNIEHARAPQRDSGLSVGVEVEHRG